MPVAAAHNPTAWLLVIHLTGMVLWIGGLWLALGAARVGHAALAQRGMRTVAHPGAALMVLSGAALIYYNPDLRTAAWLHVKLLLVVILIGLDLLVTARVRRMPQQEFPHGRVAALHAAISVLFVAILVLVLVKPF